MIKLTLPNRPAELTDEIQQQLTERFRSNCKDDVWNDNRIKNAIRKALRNMTHNKCAYSEKILGKMEIDHFKCKSKYQEDVVAWGNLLPSCSECNNAKRNHDVVAEPIINPLTDNPKDYLYVQAFRFYPRKGNDEIENIGRTTIDVLDINNKVYFESRRSNIGFGIAASIEKSFEILKSSTSNVKRNKAISDIKSDLVSCGPEYEYSAVLSTFVLYEYGTYEELEQYLRANNLWDNEFETIKQTLSEIAMPK